MSTRIYKVEDKAEENEPRRIALVRAGTPAQAMRHVAANQYEIAVATQDDLVNLVANGVKVETAGEEPAAAQ